MRDQFTICVLLYGDYPKLADRCLRSITAAIPVEHLNLRIGLNAVSPRVRDWVRSWATDAWLFDSDVNILKYPMMRQMFYVPNVETPYTIWFDDDSFITDDFAVSRRGEPAWLPAILRAMANCDLVGSVYQMPWRGQQRAWVEQQSWYAGKPHQASMRFVTGGWWCARTELLRQWDYPWPDMQHNGGDTMLGQLAYQQNWRMASFTEGVRVNASDAGAAGKAPRRGHSERPLGS